MSTKASDCIPGLVIKPPGVYSAVVVGSSSLKKPLEDDCGGSEKGTSVSFKMFSSVDMC